MFELPAAEWEMSEDLVRLRYPLLSIDSPTRQPARNDASVFLEVEGV